jgi:hypothetical protein
MKPSLIALLPLVACSSSTTPPVNCDCALQGVLSTAPTALDFGNVVVGSKATLTLMLGDIGAGTLNVADGTLQGDTAGSFALGDGGMAFIRPGESATLNVAFAPPAVGAFTAELDLPNDGTPDLVTVQLTGTGIDACALTIAPSPLTFSSLVAMQTVTVTNHVLHAVDLPCISLASVDTHGDGGCGQDSADFSFSGLPTFPTALAANESLTFTLDATATSGSDTLDVACLLPTGTGGAVFTASLTEMP